jgi:lipopolysaccharide transport system ATP-binding protein
MQPLIQAEHVSKKFCRSLKRSLWYGIQDVAHSLNPWARQQQEADLAQQTTTADLRRDEFWALQDVNFEVHRGECLGLIGHNGAGKSTLLKILNGLIRPDRGRITMRGRVGALIELNAGLNALLTGRENIYSQAALLGYSQQEIRQKFDAIVEFSELEPFLDMPVQNYSSGMKVKLGFSVFAQLRPDILIIDEILAVGDIAFRFKCLNAIGEMMRSAAVVFVSHSMPQIFRICTQLVVLDGGKVVVSSRNLAEGAAVYTSLLKEPAPQVMGNGKVSCTGVSLNSTSKITSAQIGSELALPHGADLTIAVALKSIENVQEARLEVLFWNSESVPVVEVMTESLTGLWFNFDASKSASLSCQLDSLQLCPGRYSVTVIVTDRTHSEVYCRHDNVATFSLVAESPSGAVVQPIGRWCVNGASA